MIDIKLTSDDMFSQDTMIEVLIEAQDTKGNVIGEPRPGGDLNPNLHDREIRIDNGWHIKIGRGLDFYQKPSSWFEVGANDLTLRKCLETKVDIFHEL